jgi:hypothetical protein
MDKRSPIDKQNWRRRRCAQGGHIVIRSSNDYTKSRQKLKLCSFHLAFLQLAPYSLVSDGREVEVV